MGSTLQQRVACLAAAGCLLAACDDSTQRPARAPDRQLVAWTGPYRTLFDDTIDPASLGFSLDGQSPAHHPLLAPRSTTADLVARMRVQTISRDANGARTQYLLTLQIGQPPLVRPRLQAATIDLVIAEGTGTFALVSSAENSLRGRTFIGFVRRFDGEHGPVLRWHLTADTAEVAQAVQLAAAFQSSSD